MTIVIKNQPINAGDVRDAGLILGLGRSPRGEHGNLENPIDRGAWRATVHRVAKNCTQLKGPSVCSYMHQQQLYESEPLLFPLYQ